MSPSRPQPSPSRKTVPPAETSNGEDPEVVAPEKSNANASSTAPSKTSSPKSQRSASAGPVISRSPTNQGTSAGPSAGSVVATTYEPVMSGGANAVSAASVPVMSLPAVQ